jgi:hypothetical protein
MLNNFRIQEAGGNLPSLTTVSSGAYSIWPLVTYLFHGASGIQRVVTPSAGLVFGEVTYQRLSQMLTIGAMLVISAALMFRRRESLESGGYLPLVAIGIASFLMLLTGIVATHPLLALPFFLLCRRWMGTIPYLYVAAIWTLTTLVPLFADVGIMLSGQGGYSPLAPSHNAITRLDIGLYTSDRFITVGVVANILAVIWLAALALRQRTMTRLAC